MKAAKHKMTDEPGIELPAFEHYVARLRALDASRTPPEVQSAFGDYIHAVETDAQVRRSRGDTNEANEQCNAAEVAFGAAASRYSTTRY